MNQVLLCMWREKKLKSIADRLSQDFLPYYFQILPIVGERRLFSGGLSHVAILRKKPCDKGPIIPLMAILPFSPTISMH